MQLKTKVLMIFFKSGFFANPASQGGLKASQGGSERQPEGSESRPMIKTSVYQAFGVVPPTTCGLLSLSHLWFSKRQRKPPFCLCHPTMRSK